MVTTDGPAQRNLTDGRYDSFIERIVERGVTIHALGLFTQRAGIGGGFQTGIANDVTRITGGWVRQPFPDPASPSAKSSWRWRPRSPGSNQEVQYQYAVAYEPPRGTDPDAGLSVAVRRGDVRLSISSNGRPSPAAPAVADAADVGNSREELFNQGEAAFAAGDSAQAAEWYQRAHDRGPPTGFCRCTSWGWSRSTWATSRGAKQWFQQAVEADASSPEGQQSAAILASLP